MSQILLRRAGAKNATTDADEKGRWITTENGNHIHLDKGGKPDKGNPHVIKAMKKGGKSAVGKKSDKASKASKPDKAVNAKTNKAETAKNMSLSPQEYWEKYHEPKPMGVHGDKIHFHDGNFSFRSREISLPEKGQNFGNAPDNVKSDMRAIVKGLAKNGNDPKWKEVAEKFLPAAKEFYKDADVPFTKQDLSWIEEKLGKMG